MLQQFYPVKAHNYKYELNKDMNFAAAHYIGHESAGKCQNVHGHTYFVNITIVGDNLQDNGFLVNFQELKQIAHGKYDHTLMNDFDWNGEQPSTEVVAKTIYKAVREALTEYDNKPHVLQVIVRETPTSYVTYSEQLPDEYDEEQTQHAYVDKESDFNNKHIDWSEF